MALRQDGRMGEAEEDVGQGGSAAAGAVLGGLEHPEPEPPASELSLPLLLAEADINAQQSDDPPLPYDGNVDLNLALQEATRRGDLQAVRVLFQEQKRRVRERRGSSSSVPVAEDSSTQLAEAWRALGLSPEDALAEWGEEADMELVRAGGDSLARAVKNMLQSETAREVLPRHEDVTGTPRDCSRATRLRALSLDSVWTLMEAPLRHPHLRHDAVLDLLSRLAVAQRQGLLSPPSRAFFKRLVLGGGCSLENIHTVLSAIGAPEPAALEADDGGGGVVEDLESDPLTADFHCPITHEIMLDPVTISCGHTFSRAALEHYLHRTMTSQQRDTANCPECRLPVREAPEQLNVNKLLQRTINRLCGQRLEALALQEVEGMAGVFGPEAAPRLTELLDRYPENQRLARAALEVLSSWVLRGVPTSCAAELARGRTLRHLTRRLATAHRIADDGERLWVVETVFRILRTLASTSRSAVRQLAAAGVPELALAYLRDMQAAETLADDHDGDDLASRQVGVLSDVLHVLLALLDHGGGGQAVADSLEAEGSGWRMGDYLPPPSSRHVADLCCLWVAMLRVRQRHLLAARRRLQPALEGSTTASSSSSSLSEEEEEAQDASDVEGRGDEEARLCGAAVQLWEAHRDHEELTRATLGLLTGLWDKGEEGQEEEGGEASMPASVPAAVESFIRQHCPVIVDCPDRALDTRVLAGRLLLLWSVDGRGVVRTDDVAPLLAGQMSRLLDYWSGREGELEAVLSQDTPGGDGRRRQWDAAFEDTSGPDVAVASDNAGKVTFKARGWALGPPLPPGSLVTVRFRLERDKPSDQASCMGLWLSPPDDAGGDDVSGSSSLPSGQATYHDPNANFILLRSFSGELFYRGRAVAKWPDMRVQPGQEVVMSVDTRRGKVSFTNELGRRVSKLFRGTTTTTSGGFFRCRPVVLSYGRGPPSVQPIIAIAECEVGPSPDKRPLALARLFGDCMEGQLRETGHFSPLADCVPAPIPIRTRPAQDDGDAEEEARRPLLTGLVDRSTGGGGAAALPLPPSPPTAPPAPPEEEDLTLTAALGGCPAGGKDDGSSSSSSSLLLLTPGGSPLTFSFKLKRDGVASSSSSSAARGGRGRGAEPECYIGLLGYHPTATSEEEEARPPGGFTLLLSSSGQLVLQRTGHEPITCQVKGYGRHHRLVRRQIQANLDASSPTGLLQLEVRSGSTTLWSTSSASLDMGKGPTAAPLVVRPFVAFAGHDGKKRTMSVSVSRPAAPDRRVRGLMDRLRALQQAGALGGQTSLQQQEGAAATVARGGEEAWLRGWATTAVREAVEPLRAAAVRVAEGGGAARGGEDDEEEAEARDSALVRTFGFDANTLALLVQGSRRRHIWHLSTLLLPNPVPETVEVSRLYYAGDARRLMVFGATRGARDPRALREGSMWDVVTSRDVDLPPPDTTPPDTPALPSTATTTALVSTTASTGGGGGGRPQFQVQTVELSPPLRVQAGAHLGIAARDLSIPGYRDTRFLRVPYWWASGLPDAQQLTDTSIRRLRLEFDGEGDASQIAFGYDLVAPLPAATHSPEDAGPARHEGVTDDDEDGSEHDTLHGEGGSADGAGGGGAAEELDGSGAAGMLLDPTLRRLRELDRVLGEALHTAAMRAVEEAQLRGAARGAAGGQRQQQEEEERGGRESGGGGGEEQQAVRSGAGARRRDSPPNCPVS